MLSMKLSVVDRIHPQSNKFATGVEKEATGDPKGSPDDDLLNSHYPTA